MAFNIYDIKLPAGEKPLLFTGRNKNLKFSVLPPKHRIGTSRLSRAEIRALIMKVQATGNFLKGLALNKSHTSIKKSFPPVTKTGCYPMTARIMISEGTRSSVNKVKSALRAAKMRSSPKSNQNRAKFPETRPILL